jgi:hypothetical protein
VNLQEQTRLLKQTVAIQTKWCEGLGKVNSVCANVIVDIGERLGLDQESMPLVTTALWDRAIQMPVRKARAKLGAPRVSKGLLDAKAAIGGPGVDEEMTVRKRTRKR